MTYVAVIEEPKNRSLPFVAMLRRMTWLDKLLWRVLGRKPKAQETQSQPTELHGLAIKLEADVVRMLYGLTNPDDCMCEVVEPHPIPEPMRPEDLP
jgi:hypothetical protein